MTVVDRLESLRAAVRAWENPQCSVTRRYLDLTLPLDPDEYSATLNDGAIVFNIDRIRDPLVPSESHSQIEVLRISDEGLGGTIPTHDPFFLDFNCVDIYVDLKQELMIAIEAA